MTAWERRSHETRSAGTTSIRALRLRSGARLTLLDSNPDGLTVESSARLLPGTSPEVVLATDSGQVVVRATVRHCEVAAIIRDVGVRYRAGLELPVGTCDPPIASTVAGGNDLPAPRDEAGFAVPASSAGT